MTEYTILGRFDDEYWILEREVGTIVWTPHSETNSLYKASQIIRALEAVRD